MYETAKVYSQTGAPASDGGGNYLGTQIELLKSGRLRQATMERLQVSGTNAIPQGEDGLPLAVLLSFKEVPKAAIFAITASSADPALSRNFLDALMCEYLEYKKTIRKQISGEAASSISTQVESSERELKNAQDALMSFQRTNNLAILAEQAALAGSQLAKLQTELSDLKLESQILEATPVPLDLTASGNTNLRPDSASKMPSSASHSIQYIGSGPSAVPLLADFGAQDLRKSDLASNVPPSSDRVVLLNAYNKIKMESVAAAMRDWEPKIMEANSRIAEAERLKLNVTRTQSTYDSLRVLLQNGDTSRNTDLETLAILEPASPAKRSYRQIIRALVVAGMGGLLLGGVVVFLMEKRDDRFTSVTEANSTLGSAILGLLPEVSHKGNEPIPLLEVDDPRHGYAESYRSLRSALLFLPAEGARPKVLLITSAMPNEGKSTVAANLARTLSLSGSNVVLIDADMRRGILHQLLGTQRTPGLAELLWQTDDLETIMQRDSLTNLSFIPRGASLCNPGDYLLGPTFDQLLARLRRQFDYVVIDSSPLFAAADASGLAPKMDGTLFVVRRGYSSARAADEALDLLAQRRAKVLGVVFNGADASARSYRYYKYADYNLSAEIA